MLLTTPFIARDRELEALREQLELARSGTPRIVLIDAPAGFGKTMLIDRFISEASDIQTLRVFADETESTLPFGLIDQLYRRCAGFGAESALSPSPTGDHVSAGGKLLEILGHMQEQGPAVLAVDDAHWGDPLSLRSLLFAFRRLAVDRVLVVITSRSENLDALPEGLRRLPAEGSGLRLTLDAFGEDELRQLADQLGLTGFSATAARRLQTHTGGSPLHASALMIEHPDEIRGPLAASLPAPRSYESIIVQQVRRCSAETRALVEAASVLGVQFSLRDAAALAEVIDPLGALEPALALGLVEERFAYRDRKAAFKHPLARSAVYHNIGPVRRAALHHGAAELMDDDWARLRHRAESVSTSDDELANELEAFATRETERGAWAVASVSLITASRLSSKREAVTRRLLSGIDSMLLAGDLALASAYSDDITALPEGALRDCVLGFFAVLDSRPADAERLLVGAWEQGFEDDSGLGAMIARRVALHYAYRLHGEKAVEWSERALQFTGPDIGLRTGEMLALGLGLAYSGELPKALNVVEDLMRGIDSRPGVTAVSLGRARGWLRMVSGDLTGAESDLRHEADRAAQIGSLGTAAFSLATLSRTEFQLGKWDDALVHGEQALTITEDIGHGIFKHLATLATVSVLAARGDWLAAERYLESALPAAADDYEQSILCWTLAKAYVQEARGDHAGVIKATDVIESLELREGVDEPGCWDWQPIRIGALISIGRLDEAQSLLVRHEPLAESRNRRLPIALLKRARGRLAAASGDSAAAVEHFSEAFDLLRTLPLPFETARLELLWAQTLRRVGRRRLAVELLMSSRETMSRLLATPYLTRIDAELTSSGIRHVTHGSFDRDQLTPQERSVATMVAAGLTNREVASELVLSVRTVESHLTRIYAKLGVRSRAQLAARSRRPGTT